MLPNSQPAPSARNMSDLNLHDRGAVSWVPCCSHEERQKEFSGPTPRHSRTPGPHWGGFPQKGFEGICEQHRNSCLSDGLWTLTWLCEDSRGSCGGDTQLALLASYPESPRKVPGATGSSLGVMSLTEQDPHVASIDSSGSYAEATSYDTHSSGPSENQKPEECPRKHTNQTQVNWNGNHEDLCS